MEYGEVAAGTFLARPNRFIAHVAIDGKTEICHVKNTGRCRELLIPGATVYLVDSNNEKRKYRYDLVTVEKGELLVNMDSQAPNQVFGDFLRSGGFLEGVELVKPEYRYGSSRIDFYFERQGERHLVEIKGVTLEENGICRFPDAPTDRGARHLEELARAVGEGFHAWACFVVQMKGMRWLEPNEKTDPAFAKALRKAAAAGVGVRAFCCQVYPDGLEIKSELPVRLCVQDNSL